MIFVGVTIIIGVLLFAAVAAYSVHRRSVLVDRKKEALQKRRTHIHQQDQRLLESITDSLLAGKPLADVVPNLIKQRGELLSEKGGDAGSWTPDDVDDVLNSELRTAIASINRQVALPVTLIGIAIGVLTVVSAASLYAFLEGTASASMSPSAGNSAIDSTVPYDPFAINPLDPMEANQP